MLRFHDLTVATVERLTDDSAAITFEVPEELGDAFAFVPGQSVTLRRWVDGTEHRRTYSICAAVGDCLRIGVREIPGGLVSPWLVRDVKPGHLIELTEPSGGLRADPSKTGRHLCIAAGSGITPILSIVASTLANPESNVTLLYGNREAATVMFVEELGDLKDAFGPRLDLVHVLSREPRYVELFSGRLDGARLRRLVPLMVPIADLDHVWLCGPLPMIEETRAVLQELGVAANAIHSELFFVDEPPPALQHPDLVLDAGASEVSVLLDGRVTKALMARDHTILDSAQHARGDLPFACKAGVCGTCRAMLTEGEVEMVRNYALEPPEVEAGFILTCQSFPVSAALSVDFDA